MVNIGALKETFWKNLNLLMKIPKNSIEKHKFGGVKNQGDFP